MSPKPLMSWAMKHRESPEEVTDSEKGYSHHHYLPGCLQVLLGLVVSEGRQNRHTVQAPFWAPEQCCHGM